MINDLRFLTMNWIVIRIMDLVRPASKLKTKISRRARSIGEQSFI